MSTDSNSKHVLPDEGLKKGEISTIQKGTDYKVHGYRNRWSVIDIAHGHALLENCTYGDETCYLVVRLDETPQMVNYKRNDGSRFQALTIQHVVCETFDDIETALEDEGIL